MSETAEQLGVLIVEDDWAYRQNIMTSLDADESIAVLGETSSGDEALQLTDQVEPDIVVLGFDLDAMSGLDVARIIKRQDPTIRIIMVADQDEDEMLFDAIRIGAAAYCTRDMDPVDLARIIHQVSVGEYVINEVVLSRPFVAARVLEEFRELSRLDRSNPTVFSPLTPREVEILNSVAQGNSNKEIASILGISDQTVKNHITSILRKLQVNDRTQAVIYALRQGWISLDDSIEHPES